MSIDAEHMAAFDIFERLPPELQLLVIENLGYQGAISLSQVNKHYLETIKPQAWPSADKEAFIKEAQHFAKHTAPHPTILSTSCATAFNHGGLACFTCYRVLPRHAFSGTQTSNEYAKGFETNKRKRFCLDCGLARDGYLPGTLLKPRRDGCFGDRHRQTGHATHSMEHVMCEQCERLTPCTTISDGRTCSTCRNMPVTLRSIFDGPPAKIVRCNACSHVQEVDVDRSMCGSCNNFVCYICSGRVLGHGMGHSRSLSYCQSRARGIRDVELRIREYTILHAKVEKEIERAGAGDSIDLFETEEYQILASLNLHN